MRAAVGLFWLAIVLAAALHVGVRAFGGLPIQTDLLALLPQENGSDVVGQGTRAMSERLADRVVILLGDSDRTAARAAAGAMQARLLAAGVLEPAGNPADGDTLRRLGALFYPHRAGLLAAADRQRLLQDDGQTLVDRALGQVFGFVGMANGRLLAHDPFLLLPAFLTGLPGGRVGLDDGMLTVQAEGRTWIMLTGQLTGKAFALAFQEKFQAAYAAGLQQARAAAPAIEVLRVGAVFYASAGASEAMTESSTIGIVSLLGSVLLILLVFRDLRPLLLSVAAILSGIVVALAAMLVFFGGPHVMTLLFGSSLIGVTVDYSLLYFTQAFGPRRAPRDRLAYVLPGLALGLATTVVGYLSLALSPFPGLRQIALFSAIGLIASFLSVVLWFPLLDRLGAKRLHPAMSTASAALWRFWQDRGWRRRRWSVVAVGLLLVLAGYLQLRTDDDVRRQQGLSPVLVAEQQRILSLTGIGGGGEFLLVQAADDEQALQREEALGDRLRALVAAGVLDDWQSPARFVPSAQRQRENAKLVHDRLETPYLADYRRRIGLTAAATPAAVAAASVAPPQPAPPLTLSAVLGSGALPILSTLILQDGPHGVLQAATLVGLRDPSRLRAAVADLPGVYFVNPTADISRLLGAYRQRALWLLGASALLMAPLLIWRYGRVGGPLTLLPPLLAVAATPALLALCGLPFSFFGAMGLVLVLSIGVDYAVFCAETAGQRDPVIMLGVMLATLTTMLSFGLLALSKVAGVQSFGATMLVGTALAFLLSPLAAGGRTRGWRQNESEKEALR